VVERKFQNNGNGRETLQKLLVGVRMLTLKGIILLIDTLSKILAVS